MLPSLIPAIKHFIQYCLSQDGMRRAESWSSGTFLVAQLQLLTNIIIPAIRRERAPEVVAWAGHRKERGMAGQ